MIGIEKLTIAVADMRGKYHRRACHWLVAIRLVVDECESSPALDAVREQVEKMLIQCRAFCCEYDNLRSMVGCLEAEAGVTEPKFYASPLNKTGDPAKCRQCDALARDPNLKKGDSR